MRIKKDSFRRLAIALPLAIILTVIALYCLNRSKNLVEGIVFLIAGLYIIFDLIFPSLVNKINFKPPIILVATIFIITTVCIIFSPRYSFQNAVVVLLLGILTIPVVLSGKSIQKTSARSRLLSWFTSKSKFKKALIIWVVIISVFLIWELLMAILGSGSFKAWYNNPTLTNLIKPLFNNSIFYFLSILLWLYVGLYLFRRGRP